MNIHDALGDWSARPGPLYARLAAAIGAAVDRGDIPSGTALPPERALAKRLAIGRSTVVHAYARLRERGLVASRQGSGSWVAGANRAAGAERPREALPAAALRDPTALVDLATAALPAHHRMRDLVPALGQDDEETTAALDTPGYQPAGLPALRTALAAHRPRGPPDRTGSADSGRPGARHHRGPAGTVAAGRPRPDRPGHGGRGRPDKPWCPRRAARAARDRPRRPAGHDRWRGPAAGRGPAPPRPYVPDAHPRPSRPGARRRRAHPARPRAGRTGRSGGR